MHSGHIVRCLVLLIASCSLVQAGLPEPDTVKRIVVVPLGDRRVSVDGRLDDEVWRRVPFASDFAQKEPNEGAVPSEPTEIAFLYDEHSLYVGARMRHRDRADLSSIVTRRDNSGASERIIISLDTYLDKRTAYSFSVTAAGVRTDYYHSTDEEFTRDYSFNPVWEARTEIDDQGWTAEMRIPFSQLRFNDVNAQIWGININRYIPTRNEDIYWIVVPKNGVGWSSRFGELVGIEGIRPTARVELLPYVAGSVGLTGAEDANNPFDDGTNFVARAGLDVKVGLGPNLTLDATINPDFGQVEADPAEVNLSAFETFFTERRPFFVEGSELFEVDGPTYFYSRRVGASPHGSAFGDYVDYPQNTTILGAAKLTGRLPSGLSVGALGAVTQREHAVVHNAATGEEQEVEVEPMAGYGVLRLQQEVDRSGSTAGVVLTGVDRGISVGDPLASVLARRALTGGGDVNLRFEGGEYELGANAGFSYVEGDSNAIARIQRSSARYFQRPDADHVDFDGARTSLAGYTAALSLARNGGEHWLWDLTATATSPGFELNDLGRITTADDFNILGTLRYRENAPGPIFRNYSVRTQHNIGWNFGATRRFYDVSVTADLTWDNFWTSYVGGGTQTAAQGDRLTRGGPLMRRQQIVDLWAGFTNGFGSYARWRGDFSGGFDEYDGWYYSVSGGIAMNLGDRWEISCYPSYSRTVDPRQFVADLPGGNEATFGNRYVFSFIDRSTISLQVRINYAITPDLSLEFYGEPFAASGRFYRFGELAAAGGGDLDYYGDRLSRDADGNYVVDSASGSFSIFNPDFTFRSFRSNAVLRWEWLPGSSLYLVWQQDRSLFTRSGDHVELRDLGSSITDDGDHYLALKISYWLPIDRL